MVSVVGMTLRDVIFDRMNELECMMLRQDHLSDPDMVEEHIRTISKFWRVLNDEDKDYIDGCRHAIEEKIEWKI